MGKRPSPNALAHLAAAMAHDVRNPLNTLVMTVGVVEARLRRGDVAAALKSLEVIGRSVDGIDQILTAYLDAAGPSEGPRTLGDVGQVIAAAVERARPAAAARGVEISAEVATSGRWPLDPEGLGFALDAVLDNAVEASRRGGRVAVRAREDKTSGVIEVIDDGEGMSTDLSNRAFRVGVTTRDGRAGVGLAIAKHAVRNQQGELYIRSAGPGQGASVRIEIDLTGDDVEEDDDR